MKIKLYTIFLILCSLAANSAHSSSSHKECLSEADSSGSSSDSDSTSSSESDGELSCMPNPNVSSTSKGPTSTNDKEVNMEPWKKVYKIWIEKAHENMTYIYFESEEAYKKFVEEIKNQNTNKTAFYQCKACKNGQRSHFCSNAIKKIRDGCTACKEKQGSHHVVVVCKFCKEKYACSISISSLRNHIINNHLNFEGIKCTFCETKLRSQSAYKTHIKNCKKLDKPLDKPVEKYLDSLAKKLKDAVDSQVTIHSVENQEALKKLTENTKYYKCKKRCTTEPKQYPTHIYACPCKNARKKYSCTHQTSNLRLHIKNIHLSDPQKKFPCFYPDCVDKSGKKFTLQNLKKHLRETHQYGEAKSKNNSLKKATTKSAKSIKSSKKRKYENKDKSTHIQNNLQKNEYAQPPQKRRKLNSRSTNEFANFSKTNQYDRNANKSCERKKEKAMESLDNLSFSNTNNLTCSSNFNQRTTNQNQYEALNILSLLTALSPSCDNSNPISSSTESSLVATNPFLSFNGNRPLPAPPRTFNYNNPTSSNIGNSLNMANSASVYEGTPFSFKLEENQQGSFSHISNNSDTSYYTQEVLWKTWAENNSIYFSTLSENFKREFISFLNSKKGTLREMGNGDLYHTQLKNDQGA
ncbi:MAG: hypothetical protein AAF380_00390, partial [Bacteroidota bacterium]